MKLNEIFDSKIDNLHWQTHGKYLLTAVMIDEHEYIIQIEKRSLLFFDNPLKVKSAEVSFFKADEKDNEKAFSTQHVFKKTPVSVYGVITNALIEQFNNFDAFYFSAEKRHSNNQKEFDQKKAIYFMLADRLKKKISGVELYELESETAAEYLVSKIEPNHKLKSALKEALKNFDRTKTAIFKR